MTDKRLLSLPEETPSDTGNSYGYGVLAGNSRRFKLATLPNFLSFTYPASGAVTRTALEKLADIASVKDFGVVADGSTDDTAEIQACCDRGGAYYIPYGSVIRLTAPITYSKSVQFYGDGCTPFVDIDETTKNTRGDGAWFYIDHTGKGFVFDGTSGSSDSISIIRFHGCGTFRNQPTPGGGAFTATANDWDFDVSDCEIDFEDFVPLNPTKFLTADMTRGGRIRMSRVRGQPLSRGIILENCFDVVDLDCHFWPYWSLNTQVQAYTKANLISLETGRIDGLYLRRFFTIYAAEAWRLEDSTAGTVNLAHADLLYCDNCIRCVRSLGDNATVHIDNFIAFGSVLDSNSFGLTTNGDSNRFTIGNATFDNFNNQAMFLDGTNNRASIDEARFKNYGFFSGSTPGVIVVASNSLILDNAIDDSPASTQPLFSTTSEAQVTGRVLTPSQIAGNQDNYAPDFVNSSDVLRLSSDASRNITGIVAPTYAKTLRISNVGSNPIVLKDEVTSTAANRFALSSDLTLRTDESAVLVYDLTAARWRCVAHGLGVGVSLQAWDADLDAIAALSSTGLAARTASNTWAQRSIAGTANEVTITNGDGVSGNPTASLPAALTFTGKTVTGGTFSGVTIGSTSFASGTDNTSPIIWFRTDGTTNQRKYGWNVNGTNLTLQALDDSNAFVRNLIDITFAGVVAIPGTFRINQAPSAVGTGTKTISNGADGSTNFGHYFSLNLNGTTYFIPCSSVAPT